MELSLILSSIENSISCVVPTYNRYIFIPNIIKNWINETYDITKRELIIIDDSDTFYGDKIKWNCIPGYKKYYYSSKLKLGAKRNLLNRLSNGNWIACYDDDDYYLPYRLTYCLDEMIKSKKLIGGSSKLYIYSPLNELIYSTKYYGKNHATNATFFYNRSLLLITNYNDDDEKAEEVYFLKQHTLDMHQFDSLKVIIVIAHLLNTVDKYKSLKYFELTDIDSNDIMPLETKNFYNKIIEKQLL